MSNSISINLAVVAFILTVSSTSPVAAGSEYVWGGKLDLTRGVSTIEGAGGGGLVPWALIAGNETKDGVGGQVSATYVETRNYALTGYSAAIGAWDRVEISYARQDFDTGQTGRRLGLGPGYTFHQDIYGAKVRLAGDAVFDQDRWTPQIAAGVEYKRADHTPLLHALGAKRGDGVDLYVSATKIYLDRSLLVDATLRLTQANQFGLLGFGGGHDNNYALQAEGSVGYLLTPKLLIGAELRTKPSNLAFAKETQAGDLFAALAFNKTVSLTVAYVDLGSIATFRSQSGPYISMQAGF